jgi:hypothetical protein
MRAPTLPAAAGSIVAARPAARLLALGLQLRLLLRAAEGFFLGILLAQRSLP